MERVPVSWTSKLRLPPLGISPASDGRDDPVFLVGLEGGGGPFEALFTFRGVLQRTGCQVQAPANPAADAKQSRLTSGDFTDSPVKASVLKQVNFTLFFANSWPSQQTVGTASGLVGGEAPFAPPHWEGGGQVGAAGVWACSLALGAPLAGMNTVHPASLSLLVYLCRLSVPPIPMSPRDLSFCP